MKIRTFAEYLAAVQRLQTRLSEEEFNELYKALAEYEVIPIAQHVRAPSCDCANPNVVRSVEADAYCCINCNRWLERQCGDEECTFCKDRPATPVAVP